MIMSTDDYKFLYGKLESSKIPIVSIKLEDMENSMTVVIPRFQIGARWFDDIVINNAAREK